MPRRRTFFILAIAFAAVLWVPAKSLCATPSAPLTINGLGKGVAPLEGPWQFHLGDNPAWAAPGVDDVLADS